MPQQIAEHRELAHLVPQKANFVLNLLSLLFYLLPSHIFPRPILSFLLSSYFHLHGFPYLMLSSSHHICFFILLSIDLGFSTIIECFS